MTAMTSEAAREYWKRDNEFPGFEVSNTGRVRNVQTGVGLPVYGSGGKAMVKLVDAHGRRHDRNLRRLVRKLFGIAPIRIVPQPPTTAEENTVTDETFIDQDADWVALSWPGAKKGQYRISRDGKVQSRNLDGPLTPTIIRSTLGNYPVVNLQREEREGFANSYFQVRLNELVAVHFVGESPGEDYTPKHLNGDRMDCRAENLEWAKRVRQVFRPSKVSASAQRRLKVRDQRARKLAADPNWRLVNNPRITPNQYWVSKDAVVRGVTGQDLTQFTYENGHVGVYMKSAQTNNNTTIQLGLIVLEAFCGEAPTSKHRVQHRNKNVTDCRVDNLYWGIPGQEAPQPPVVEDPEPAPAPIITPTRAQVTVTTLASYRIGEVEVIVNNGIIEPPEGGTAVQQAAALAQIYAEIAKGEGQ